MIVERKIRKLIEKDMIEKELFKKNYKKIKKVLECADTTSYYHALFVDAGIDLSGEITYEDFSRIAKTEKKTYEKNKYGMISNRMKGYDLDEMKNLEGIDKRYQYFKKNGIHSKTTSGSTGQPLEVLKSMKDEFRDYVNLNYYRRKMTNYDFSGQFVQIWPVNRAVFKTFFPNDEPGPNMYARINDNGYRYSLCEHSKENLKDLYDFIIEKECEWITSPPTVLYKLADLIEENRLAIPNIKYIECHSEKLYDWQKDKIIKVFNCDITSIYSSNEVMFMAGGCKNGKMHLFDKSCFMEIIPDEHGNNEIVVTSLNYFDIPVIRYKLGDCGKWIENQECGCELSDSYAFEIYGFRKNDYIKTESGVMEPFVIADSIYNLSYNNGVKIKEYRVVQTDYNKFCFYIAKDFVESNKSLEIKKSLTDFLNLGLEREDIDVELRVFDLDESTYFSRKFRYFESIV